MDWCKREGRSVTLWIYVKLFNVWHQRDTAVCMHANHMIRSQLKPLQFYYIIIISTIDCLNHLRLCFWLIILRILSLAMRRRHLISHGLGSIGSMHDTNERNMCGYHF